MKFFAVFVAVAIAVASAGHAPSHYGADHYGPAHYSFDYAVKDGHSYADFGHQENRNGDNTRGSYHVLLPDGRRQVVNYYVDGHSGYVADVQYVGEAKYDYKPAYKPAYSPAPAYGPAYEPRY